MSFAFDRGELRRGTRLMLPIPIVLHGNDSKGEAFTEKTRTLCINQHGGLLETQREIGMGKQVLIENPALGQTAPAKVIRLETGQGGSGFRVSFELIEPQNIWGIDFPPSDWKIKQPQAEKTGPIAIALPAGQPTAAPDEEDTDILVPAPVPTTQASAPPPPVASLDEVRTIAEEAVIGFAKQLEGMIESARSTWHAEMAKLGEEMRQAFREDMERWFGACLESAAVQLRKQIETEAAIARQRIHEVDRLVTEGALQSVRTKLAAMMAALDAPARAQAAAASAELRSETPEG
jgi:hypothetical protein